MASQRSNVPATESPLYRELAARRARGDGVLDLTATNPTQVGLSAPSATPLAPLGDARSLVYDPEPFGLLEARTRLAEEWARRGVGVDAGRIALTASTSEGYAHCFRLFCDPGDSVLVPRPSYPLIDEIARYEGVRLVPYRIDYDGAWHIDFDSVRAALGPTSRAIVAVSPNNPTGHRLGVEDVRTLAAFGLPLVVDEVFATYPLEGAGITTALSVTDAPLVVLDGLSKTAALPQMKVGWMTLGGPEPFVRDCIRRLEVMLDAFLSVATPQQWALGTWLAGKGQARDEISERTRQNLALLRHALEGAPVSVPRVEAGWYAMLRLPDVLTDDAWALRLLGEGRTFTHPGWLYDAAPGPWIVVSLLPESETMRAGTRAIRRVVEAVCR